MIGPPPPGPVARGQSTANVGSCRKYGMRFAWWNGMVGDWRELVAAIGNTNIPRNPDSLLSPENRVSTCRPERGPIS